MILLTKDDGIKSKGILAIRKELERIDDVFVIAPLRQRSGIGKALSFEINLYREKMLDGYETYAIDGNPADAVLLTLTELLSNKPKIVVAGINEGPNLGLEDFLNSGTIGAVMEAALHGVPGVSVSLVARHSHDYDKLTLSDFRIAAIVGSLVVEYILKYGMPEGVDFINVNVPLNLSGYNIKVTKVGWNYYYDIYERHGDKFKVKCWSIDKYITEAGSDIEAIKNGFISIGLLSTALKSP